MMAERSYSCWWWALLCDNICYGCSSLNTFFRKLLWICARKYKWYCNKHVSVKSQTTKSHRHFNSTHPNWSSQRSSLSSTSLPQQRRWEIIRLKKSGTRGEWSKQEEVEGAMSPSSAFKTVIQQIKLLAKVSTPAVHKRPFSSMFTTVWWLILQEIHL